MYEGRNYTRPSYGGAVYYTSASERFLSKEKAEAREKEIKEILRPLFEQIPVTFSGSEARLTLRNESELKIFYITSNILRDEFRTVWGRKGRKFSFPVEGTLNLKTKEVTVGGFDIDRCI